MNKKSILIIIGIVIVVVGVVLVIMKLTTSNTIEITHEETRGVPYTWDYEIEYESIVRFVKKYNLNKNNTSKGGTDKYNYVFKGLKKGSTAVTFKKLDYYTGETVSEEHMYLIVDGRKNISLLAVPKE